MVSKVFTQAYIQEWQIANYRKDQMNGEAETYAKYKHDATWLYIWKIYNDIIVLKVGKMKKDGIKVRTLYDEETLITFFFYITTA